MAKSNRTCYLCGTKYEYCPNCGHHDPIYKATFCSENCKEIFHSLSKFGSGSFTADECKKALKHLDLSRKPFYKESVQNTIEQVYATSVAVVEDKVETKEEEIVENIQPIGAVEIVEAVAEVITEEPIEVEAEVVVETPVIPRTRKSRKHEVVLEDE